MKTKNIIANVFVVIVLFSMIIGCATPKVSSTPSTELPKMSPTSQNQPTPTAEKNSGPAIGSKITEAVSTDAQSFQIYLTTDNTSRDYQFRVYASGLWQRDPKTNLPVPYMAESWSVSDDGKTYTFKLRKDMKWSDGVPITATDFVWTFEQANKPENKYPYISILKGISSYTANDDYTVVVAMNDAGCTSILTAGQITPLPKHTWEKLDWSNPDKNPEILKPSVVSGPWKLKEWKRDEFAEFVPNESYFGSVPKVNSYIVQIVPQSSIQFQMLKTGEVDYARVSASDFTEAKKLANLKLYEWDPAQPTWYFIGFNFKQPLLQDVELRHALSYALPRDAIANNVFSGLAKALYSTYSPPSWVYNPEVPKYDYNINTAKAILDKAGYKVDSSGNRLDKDGNPIKLSIYYPSTDKQREQIATIAQEEFKKLGVALELTGMESKALYDYLQKNPSGWDMWAGLSRDTSDPHFMYQAWSEFTIPAINTGSYINKQVDDLYKQGNTSPCNTDARKKVYQQIQQIISADSPYIFLVYNTGYAFVSNRVVVNPPSVLGIDYRKNEWLTTK